jgi:AbrB family looped-hinge helix DNA binding protein
MAAQSPILEYLATTRIGEKGQLTVPKQFREDLGLETGAPFAVLRIGDALLLIPEQDRFDALCDEIREAFAASGATPASMLDTLPEVRADLYRERYSAPSPRILNRQHSRRTTKQSSATRKTT